MGSKLFDVAIFDTLLLADTAGPRYSVYKKSHSNQKLYLLLYLVPHNAVSTSGVSTYVDFGLCVHWWGMSALVETSEQAH